MVCSKMEKITRLKNVVEGQSRSMSRSGRKKRSARVGVLRIYCMLPSAHICSLLAALKSSSVSLSWVIRNAEPVLLTTADAMAVVEYVFGVPELLCPEEEGVGVSPVPKIKLTKPLENKNSLDLLCPEGHTGFVNGRGVNVLVEPLSVHPHGLVGQRDLHVGHKAAAFSGGQGILNS